MVQEAALRGTPGLVPEGDGWFIVNVRDARWKHNERFGKFAAFEGEARFPHFGLNVHVLEANQPACMYHRESMQEDFLVLWGNCRVIVEGQERALKQWDLVHCPPDTNHVFVGGPDGPCAVLMIGSRHEPEAIVYPVEPVAQKFGAGVDVETPDPRVAYAGTPPSTDTECPWPA